MGSLRLKQVRLLNKMTMVTHSCAPGQVPPPIAFETSGNPSGFEFCLPTSPACPSGPSLWVSLRFFKGFLRQFLYTVKSNQARASAIVGRREPQVKRIDAVIEGSLYKNI